MIESKAKRGSTIALWVLRVLVALLFLATGAMKLLGAPMAIHEFDQIGFGQGFRIFTGAVEVLGALLAFFPRSSTIGASLLFCVSIGALIAQAASLHQDVIHPVVLMALTGLLAWASRRTLPWMTAPRP